MKKNRVLKAPLLKGGAYALLVVMMCFGLSSALHAASVEKTDAKLEDALLAIKKMKQKSLPSIYRLFQNSRLVYQNPY